MKNNTVDYAISEMRVSDSPREMEVNKVIGEMVACMYGDKVNEKVIKFIEEMKKPVFNYRYELFEYENLL